MNAVPTDPPPGDRPHSLDPTVEQTPPSAPPSPSADTVDGTIGSYRLLQKLGEGGMGEVWLAEQTKPVRRRVALKLIKAGMDTKAVLARFDAERQALALMNHPCIARVFDAGSTERGRPYFAMEYVDGESITDYCDRHRLSTDDRLRLFMPVCEGLHHAHQKGIVHRDLKPSNILVRIQDDRPAPKIIDFGVAKAIEHRLTEQTLFTQIGAIVGTPEFMSPEQAEMSGLDVDTRTDVYSLGVILYVLLVGALPFDTRKLREAGMDGIRRTIREEDPSRPSTRISAAGEESTETAARRRTDPSTLRRILRGDLDWITMKALEKDRTRRYGSPNELAADVERHLSHHPVTAGPPSAAYRMGKFVRRHRVGVAVGAFAVLLLAATALISSMLYLRAEAARSEAEFQAYTASLAASVSALERNEPQAVRRRLGETVESLRGWECAGGWGGADRSLETVLELPSRSENYRVDLSPDGRLAAARVNRGGFDPIHVYDLESGEMVHELPTWECSSIRFTFSADGRYLAFGAEGEPSVEIWDLRDGHPLIPLERTMDYHRFLGFDAAGERAALIRWAPTPGTNIKEPIVVVRLRDWTELARIPARWDELPWGGDFSPDGRLLAVGLSEWESGFRVYDIESGRLVKEVRDLGSVGRVRFAPDGAYLVTLGSRDLIVWDTKSWERLNQIEQPGSGAFTDFVFTEVTGRPAIIVSGSDGILRAFRPLDKAPRYELRGEPKIALSFAVDSTTNRLLSAHAGGAVKRWPLVPEWRFFRSSLVAALQFWKGEALLWSAASANSEDPRVAQLTDVVGVRSPAALRQFAVTHSHGAYTIGFALDPTGTRAALTTRSGWRQGRLKIFDLATGLGTYSPEPFFGRDPNALAWSDDGRWIAVVGNRGFVRVWDSENLPAWRDFRGHAGHVRGVVFHRGRLVTSGEDGTIRTWDLVSGEQTDRLASPDSVGLTRLAVLGRDRLAAGTLDGRILIWNPARAAPQRELPGHAAPVVALALTPDGSRLVSGALDGSIVFWDTRTWRELVSFHFDTLLRDLAFGPNGDRLAFGAGIVRTLDRRPEAQREAERINHAEAAAVGAAWLDDLQASGLEGRALFERIESSEVQTPIVKSAALFELLARRDSAFAVAYDEDRAQEIAWPSVRRQMLRDLCVSPESDRWWLDFGSAAEEIRARADLSDVEREAGAEYAHGARYWNHANRDLRGEGVWTNALIGEVLSDSDAAPDDVALAWFAAEELCRALPQRPEFQRTLARARSRFSPAARDSLQALRHALGVGDPDGPYSQYTLAVRCFERGELDEAERLFRKSIATMRKNFGDRYGFTDRSMARLGDVLHAAGRLDEAERSFRDAVSAARLAHGDEDDEVIAREQDLARFLQATGRGGDAR